MALRTALTGSLGCGNCRSQLLRCFVATTGVDLHVPRHQPTWQTRQQQASAFSHRARLLSQQDEVARELRASLDKLPEQLAEEEEQAPEQEELVPNAPLRTSNEPSASPSTPWYLQVNPPPSQLQHPLSERQRLPELPETPPPLLQPILEHVSVELGLDDLSLLDLRSLDPPPALGANLIMIVGTARSEKHLHVSADRLARWLRSSHALSPYADGLLGRNELKLKLKRKAKRSRLLSAVGTKETSGGDVDDGIRTGWVCVNVGRVEGGILKKAEQAGAAKAIVGFGSQTEACRIVVQMMTEEKRGQLDLETLWNGILRRANKRTADDAVEEEADQRRLDEGQGLEGSASAALQSTYNPFSVFKDSQGAQRGQQARAFHSMSRKRLQANTLAVGDSALPIDPRCYPSRATATFRRMLDQLEAMEDTPALAALGRGSDDQSSTPFLEAFYNAIPSFPEATHWDMHIALRCHAVHLGHQGYTPDCLTGALEDMQLACIIPTEQTYLRVLQALLKSSANSAMLGKTRKSTMTGVLDILDQMHDNGLNPVSSPILQTLYTYALPPSTSTSSDPKLEVSNSLHHLLPSLALEPIRLAAAAADWPALWQIWSSYPQRFLPRSAAMYALVLNAAADSADENVAADALRRCVPAMSHEEPPVEMRDDSVREAVARCLLLAEPGAEGLGRGGGLGEWAVLWRRVHA